MSEQRVSNTLNMHQNTADDLDISYDTAKSINFALLYGKENPLLTIYNLLKDSPIEWDGPNRLRLGDVIIGMNSPNTFYVCDGVGNVVDDDIKRVASTAIRSYYNIIVEKAIKAIYKD